MFLALKKTVSELLSRREGKAEKLKQAEKQVWVGMTRKDLADITGSDIRARILNYFIYKQHAFEQDWVPGGAGTVKDWCVLTCSESTITRHIKALVQEGYLEWTQPEKWSRDRSMRYWVKMDFVYERLEAAGWGETEKSPKPAHSPSVILHDASVTMKDAPVILQDAPVTMKDDLKKQKEKQFKKEAKTELPACSIKNSDSASGLTPSSAAPLSESMGTKEAFALVNERLVSQQLLMEQGVMAPKAADLAERFPLEKIRAQVEALPHRIAALEAKGKEVPKRAGLLIASITANNGQGYELPAMPQPHAEPAAPQNLEPDPWVEKLKSATAFVSEKGTRYLIRLIRESQQMVDFVLESDPNRPQSRPFSVLKQGGYVFE